MPRGHRLRVRLRERGRARGGVRGGGHLGHPEPHASGRGRGGGGHRRHPHGARMLAGHSHGHRAGVPRYHVLDPLLHRRAAAVAVGVFRRQEEPYRGEAREGHGLGFGHHRAHRGTREHRHGVDPADVQAVHRAHGLDQHGRPAHRSVPYRGEHRARGAGRGTHPALPHGVGAHVGRARAGGWRGVPLREHRAGCRGGSAAGDVAVLEARRVRPSYRSARRRAAPRARRNCFRRLY